MDCFLDIRVQSQEYMLKDHISSLLATCRHDPSIILVICGFEITS